MPFFKNKVVIALTSVIVATIIFAVILNVVPNSNPVSAAVRTVFAPFQKVVSSVDSSVNNFTAFIFEMKGYKAENERLVSEINALKREQRSVEEYKIENDRLNELLALKDELSEFETVAARVIAKNTSGWLDRIEINKGKKEGLMPNDIVITPDGVVGLVTEVGAGWSAVDTIINPEHALGVRVVRTSDIAIVEGDLSFAKDGFCRMNFISRDAGMVVGDILETSGLGGIYPSSLAVGKIREMKSDNKGTLQYAVVEPFVDFDNIYEVLVIKRGENAR